MNDYERFIIARWMYSIGEQIMSDAEYTVLFDTIKITHPDSVYLTRSWSSDPCPIELLKKYGYENAIRDIILSDKTESIPSINDWVTLRGMYSDLNEEATLSFKHDGWNIQADYYNGERVNIQTRGRLRDAISAKVVGDMIPYRIPEMGKRKICMEATVPHAAFAEMKAEIGSKSQRGAVSTCLARPEYTSMLSLNAFSIVGDEQVMNPFELLESWGFRTVRWTKVHNWDELIEAMHLLDKERDTYPYPTDGLVLRCSLTRAIRLLSWEEPIYKSYVTGYDETYGMYRVGVKAKIYPVRLPNSTQRLVSCTNYQRVIDNNLRVGYPIAFRFSSMAIADLDEVSTRLLQEQWVGREAEYRQWVNERERISSEG